MSDDILRLDPPAAAKIVSSCYALAKAVGGIRSSAKTLSDVTASGTYHSGATADQKFSDLGQLAITALNKLSAETAKAGAAARAAGQALVNQDDANQRAIARALESPDGIDPVQKSLPFGIGLPNSGSQPQIDNQPTLPVKPSAPPSAGQFSKGLTPEAPPIFLLAPALQALRAGVPTALNTLTMQWFRFATRPKLAPFYLNRRARSIAEAGVIARWEDS